MGSLAKSGLWSDPDVENTSAASERKWTLWTHALLCRALGQLPLALGSRLERMDSHLQNLPLAHLVLWSELWIWIAY